VGAPVMQCVPASPSRPDPWLGRHMTGPYTHRVVTMLCGRVKQSHAVALSGAHQCCTACARPSAGHEVPLPVNPLPRRSHTQGRNSQVCYMVTCANYTQGHCLGQTLNCFEPMCSSGNATAVVSQTCGQTQTDPLPCMQVLSPMPHCCVLRFAVSTPHTSGDQVLHKVTRCYTKAYHRDHTTQNTAQLTRLPAADAAFQKDIVFAAGDRKNQTALHPTACTSCVPHTAQAAHNTHKYAMLPSHNFITHHSIAWHSRPAL
jgi:hypothetical protein